MDHLTLERGFIAPASRDFYRRIRFYTRQELDGVAVFGGLALSEAAQREEQLLGVILSPVVGRRALFTEAFRSFAEVWWALSHFLPPERLRERAWSVATHPLSALAGAYLVKRSDLSRVDYFGLHAHIEQAPYRDNRITLSAERDELGLNRPHLDWTIGDLEVHSLRRTVQIIDEELRVAGLGQIRLDLSEHTLRGGLETIHHHMGTTRMHRDPKRGVVDENCRVHGVSNLFVAGSSVFPSGGAASVTLSIVALAMRLADYLKQELAQTAIRLQSAPSDAS